MMKTALSPVFKAGGTGKEQNRVLAKCQKVLSTVLQYFRFRNAEMAYLSNKIFNLTQKCDACLARAELLLVEKLHNPSYTKVSRLSELILVL